MSSGSEKPILPVSGSNGYTTRAPRNRTLFLTEEDVVKYAVLPTLPDQPPVAEGIYLSDCVQGMKSLDAGIIDLVFADPPYNLGRDFGNSSDKQKTGDYLKWTVEWVRELARVVKPTASIYICCHWELSGKIQDILSEHFIIRNRITWKRDKGRGASKNWKSNMEDIWFCTVGEDYTFNLEDVKVKKPVIAPYRDDNGRPKDWNETEEGRIRYTHPSNIWTDLCVPFWSMPENTPHPTQKPEKLVERAILASSNPGNLVFDPFLGSGTTAVVAKKTGRRFLGFEINEDYLRLALKRLEKAEPGLGLL